LHFLLTLGNIWRAGPIHVAPETIDNNIEGKRCFHPWMNDASTTSFKFHPHWNHGQIEPIADRLPYSILHNRSDTLERDSFARVANAPQFHQRMARASMRPAD